VDFVAWWRANFACFAAMLAVDFATRRRANFACAAATLIVGFARQVDFATLVDFARAAAAAHKEHFVDFPAAAAADLRQCQRISNLNRRHLNHQSRVVDWPLRPCCRVVDGADLHLHPGVPNLLFRRSIAGWRYCIAVADLRHGRVADFCH